MEIADGSSQHAQQCVGADASAGHRHRLAFSSTCKGKDKKEKKAVSCKGNRRPIKQGAVPQERRKSSFIIICKATIMVENRGR